MPPTEKTLREQHAGFRRRPYLHWRGHASAGEWAVKSMLATMPATTHASTTTSSILHESTHHVTMYSPAPPPPSPSSADKPRTIPIAVSNAL
eukprot:scaffold346_cov387-Prasinococcus_capsulatus_cf.AAC.5